MQLNKKVSKTYGKEQASAFSDSDLTTEQQGEAASDVEDVSDANPIEDII
jgi:hypothetical protein